MVKIKIKQATVKGYEEMINNGVADLSYPSSHTRRGRVQGGGMISPTLTCTDNAIYRIRKESDVMSNIEYAIRKLTPTECGRLMGFDDNAIEAMLSINSNTQVYKECGNSIVTPVLCAIFSQLDIKGVPKWNDLSIANRYSIVEKGCYCGRHIN